MLLWFLICCWAFMFSYLLLDFLDLLLCFLIHCSGLHSRATISHCFSERNPSIYLPITCSVLSLFPSPQPFCWSLDTATAFWRTGNETLFSTQYVAAACYHTETWSSTNDCLSLPLWTHFAQRENIFLSFRGGSFYLSETHTLFSILRCSCLCSLFRYIAIICRVPGVLNHHTR